VLVEEALELLVGHIDAKLLKAVLIKVLKAKDVKDANLVQLFFLPSRHACRTHAVVEGESNFSQRAAYRAPAPVPSAIPGDRSSLICVTIQLKRRPYNALATASRQSRA
jgi:hypothetical protein